MTKIKAADLLRETITPMRVPTEKTAWGRWNRMPFRVRVAEAKADMEKVPKGGRYGYYDRGTHTVDVRAAKFTFTLDIDRDKYIAVPAETYGYTLADIAADKVPVDDELRALNGIPIIFKKQYARLTRIGAEKDPAKKNEVKVEFFDRYEVVVRGREGKEYKTLDGARTHVAKYVNRKVRVGEATKPLVVRKAQAAVKDAERQAEYLAEHAARDAQRRVEGAERLVEQTKADIERLQATLLERLRKVDEAEQALAKVETTIAAAKAKATVAKAKADLIIAGAGLAA